MLLKKKEARQAESPHRTEEEDFKRIMTETTHDMSWYRRIVSQFIHAKGVSPASGLIGRTIARPNAILFGAICSFTLTLGVYLLSKNLGYSLSGFEPIGAFMVGWIAGLLFDILSAALKKK